MSHPMTDEEFLRAFLDQSLPLEQWNHRAHLKVAYLHLLQHSFEDALPKVRAGIRAYNTAHRIEDTPTGGYHETLTCAWLQLVYGTLRQFGPAEDADTFLNTQSQLAGKRVLLFFYSRDRIMSAEAKHTFLPPDLTPLPSPLE